MTKHVEGRPVPERLEGLAFEFDGRAHFFEVAGDAYDAVHGDEEAENALKDDVQRQHGEVLFGEAEVGPVLSCGYRGVDEPYDA